MPRGPKGEKRPADVVGAAIKVAKIATGEIEEMTDDSKDKAAAELGRKGGKVRATETLPKRLFRCVADMAGIAIVIYSDTLQIHGPRIRPHGVNAPREML